jgi:hypothetical protein
MWEAFSECQVLEGPLKTARNKLSRNECEKLEKSPRKKRTKLQSHSEPWSEVASKWDESFAIRRKLTQKWRFLRL